MASPPRLRAFLFCDGVVKDPVTGKTTLVGVFEALALAEFPAEPATFVIYAVFAGLNGRCRFDVEIVSDDLQTVIKQSALDETFETDDPLRTFEAIVQLDDVAWPSPGRYAVRLRYNGHLLEDAPLTVEDLS